MRRWVDFITSVTETPRLWTGHFHFGDWLGLDAPAGSYKGSTREDFIATAFYAHSAELVVKTGRLLGRDVSAYEKLYGEIVDAFRKTFPEYRTQTEHVLAVYFGLAENPQKTADDLADMVRADGVQLRTGFVGTPYILHVLSRYGYADLAWSLVLRREYPGWLYPVTKGATTIWEHWDGIKPDGSFWSKDMNSFNHYAYGAVADWVFEQAAGIRHAEDKPGFEELIYAPHPDKRLGWLQAKLDTRHGTVSALWVCQEDGIRYELETPVRTRVCLNGRETWINPGKYTFWTVK
jgi:alpha-L-rhamnosidase